MPRAFDETARRVSVGCSHMRCWWPQSLCDGPQVRLEREELLASLEDQTSELEAREQEVIL